MNKLIISNFKSNKSVSDTNLWLNTFLKNIDDSLINQFDVSLAPSFVSLASASEIILEANRNLTLSVQDISPFPAGSYTGAISIQNLIGLNVKYAIVGHSERRKYFKETSHDVALKVEQSLQDNILPVLCIDEDYLEEQLGLIDKENLAKCVVAYEPAGAIGSGKNADVGTVQNVIKKVRKIAGDIKVIYGGSVNDQNINEYLLVSDGVLISSYSLDALDFIKALKAANRYNK